MISTYKQNIPDNNTPAKSVFLSEGQVFDEPLSIDEIIDRALGFCSDLPYKCDIYVNQIRELKSRLAHGKMHLAVLGQFNRGKSTFLNALIGLKVLPTSVLPITSVPTIISYGDHISCRVRFLDQKPDLIVRQSLDSIQDTLRKYVAEENNPNNQLCVKEVEVSCQSPLLENGTVLLDTPGFGSTHLHNTRVALTTLTECDAAIFLLSADPPLTQTELEFLKQVNLYVPRIFFVLNKTDLLSKDELAAVDRFIKEVLIMQMKYPADLKLFHICAREGEKAQGVHNHQSWNASGMNVIKSEILDFMIREKYFTLSQALNEKFREALSGIYKSITEEIRDFAQPIDLLRSEFNDIQEHTAKLKKISEKEIGLTQIEENALVKFLGEQISAAIIIIQNELSASFDKLIVNATLKQDSMKSLSAALENIALEKIDKFYLTGTNSCNKPLRKAILIHIEQFRLFINDVKTILAEKAIENIDIAESFEQCEINPVEHEDRGIIDISFIVEYNMFRTRSEQIERYKKQFQSCISTVIPQQMQTIKEIIEEQIKNNFKIMYDLLEKNYGMILKLLENSLTKKDTAIQERNQNSGTRSVALEQKIAEFEKIRQMLI